MNSTFPQGRELIDIIERHDWLLYDTTQSTREKRAFTWEELQRQQPADQLDKDHNYLFVPRPESGQTVREAYAVTKGLGPSLTIKDKDDSQWLSLSVAPKKLPGYVAQFSRLFLEDEYVVASSPRALYNPCPDIVVMPYESIVDTFKNNFRIITPEELGVRTPIPMPIIPWLN